MNLKLLKKYYKEGNIELFNLYIPNYTEILKNILQEDNLDEYTKLCAELRIIQNRSKVQCYIEIKNLQIKWHWFIKNNLKSKTCKIIRFLFVNYYNIYGVIIHELLILSRKFSLLQKYLISDVIKYYKLHKFGKRKYSKISVLIIQPENKYYSYNYLEEIMNIEIPYHKYTRQNLLKIKFFIDDYDSYNNKKYHYYRESINSITFIII